MKILPFYFLILLVTTGVALGISSSQAAPVAEITFYVQ